MERRDQTDKSSTAYETAHTKEKVDAKKKGSTQSGWKRVPDLRSSMLKRAIG